MESARTSASQARRSPTRAADQILAVYLARHAAGLGPSMRLVEFALTDPRLSHSERQRIATALLLEMARSDVWRPNPAAFQALKGVDREIAARHASLIARMLEQAPTARAGESALRVAYLLGEEEGSVPSGMARLASEAAAILRERREAQLDAIDLLAIRPRSTAILDSLRVRRRERRLLSERPPLSPLGGEERRLSARMAPLILQQIRTLGAEGPLRYYVPEQASARPVMPRPLDAVVWDTINLPPSASVSVGLNLFPHLARRLGVEDGAAWSEERLAVELTRHPEWTEHPGLARAILWVGASLLSLAQEEAHWPGDEGPPPSDLEERHGVRVTFDASVPVEWQGYYRHMIADALADMVRALPGASFRGLEIRVAPPPKAGSLALHTPSARRIVLPPATGSGTLAHELAHDLDWQWARRRDGIRGDYGSDRALSHAPHSGAAALLQQLTEEPLRVPSKKLGIEATHDERPAEVLARHVDAFTVERLAVIGRSNGHLSSAQDEVLTGYGTVRPPDPGKSERAALTALLSSLLDMTFAPADPPPSLYGLVRRELGQALASTVPAPGQCRVMRLEEEAHLLELARQAAERGARQAWQRLVGPVREEPVPQRREGDRSRNPFSLAAAALVPSTVLRAACPFFDLTG